MNATGQGLAIALRGVQYGYKKDTPIIKNLDMSVGMHSIYGFLGINGAGKSTTIRNILGLLSPDAGTIKLHGKYENPGDIECLMEIGSLVESPSIYRHLNARDNLRICALYRNVEPGRVDDILALVGLAEAGKKKAKHFSTGMLQRLGLGIALLSDPDLLILDEPTSGLDPHGIIEIRALLKTLQARGKTIFLSSHQLAEIEILATEVGVLHEGRLIFEGSIESLQEVRSGSLEVEIEVSAPAQCVAALGSGYAPKIVDENRLRIPLSGKQQIPAVLRQLLDRDIDVFEVGVLKAGLEELFVSLTKSEVGNE
ncbi:MAG: ABC transporter ATP-binding protein [Bacteroidota bacterium]